MTISFLLTFLFCGEVERAVRRGEQRGAGKAKPGETILVNLSGRGDKDIDFVAEKLGI